MRETLDSEWATPCQARGLASMERMLDAAQNLLENTTFDELKVIDIVKQAETSVGSFYNRFKTKDGLLRCLKERFVGKRRRDLERALAREDWKGADLGERVALLTRLSVRFNREQRGVFRTLRLRQLHGQDGTNAQDVEDHQKFCSGFFNFLLECKSEMEHPCPERAVKIGILSMTVMSEQMLLFDHTLVSSEVECGDEVLAEELSQQLLSYLGSAPRVALEPQIRS